MDDDISLALKPGDNTSSEFTSVYADMVPQWQSLYGEIAGASAPTHPTESLHQDPQAVRVAFTAQRLIESAMLGLSKFARRVTGSWTIFAWRGESLSTAAPTV